MSHVSAPVLSHHTFCCSNLTPQVKVPDGVAANGNPEGNYYLWLLENAAEISPVELVEASSLQLSMASYYIG